MDRMNQLAALTLACMTTAQAAPTLTITAPELDYAIGDLVEASIYMSGFDEDVCGAQFFLVAGSNVEIVRVVAPSQSPWSLLILGVGPPNTVRAAIMPSMAGIPPGSTQEECFSGDATVLTILLRITGPGLASLVFDRAFAPELGSPCTRVASALSLPILPLVMINWQHQVDLPSLAPILGTGDYDGDGDVDLVDWNAFQLCYSGQDVPYPEDAGCTRGDFDGDGDVDLVDHGRFQLAFRGLQ